MSYAGGKYTDEPHTMSTNQHIFSVGGEYWQYLTAQLTSMGLSLNV